MMHCAQGQPEGGGVRRGGWAGRLTVAALGLACLSSCAGGGVMTLFDSCVAPIEDMCAKQKCPTYAASIAELKAAPPGNAVALGTCGSYRYITWFSNVAVTAYYDPAGNQVAGAFQSDRTGDKCSGAKYFGQRMDCAKVQTEYRDASR